MCHEPKTIPVVLAAKSSPRHSVQSGTTPGPLALLQPKHVPLGSLGPPLPNTSRHCNGSHCAIPSTLPCGRWERHLLPGLHALPDASPGPASTKGPPTYLQHCLVHCRGLQETLCSPKKEGEDIVKKADTGLNFVILSPLKSTFPSSRYS